VIVLRNRGMVSVLAPFKAVFYTFFK